MIFINERYATRSLFVAALCFVFALSASAQDVSGGQWIDLTHPFNAETVYWPTAKTFEKETVFAGHTEGGYYHTAYNFAAAEHGGTHLDAPIHFAEGRLTADQLSALEHRHRGEDAPKTRLLAAQPG
jgi:hypothetical protein